MFPVIEKPGEFINQLIIREYNEKFIISVSINSHDTNKFIVCSNYKRQF
jgi:hypothetical protein